MTLTNQPEHELREKIALFRYGLIADVINLPPGTSGIYEKLRDKAAKEHDIPGTQRRHVAVETRRDWLKKYRKGGFDALLPRRRNDLGRSRSLPQEIADVLLVIKEECPDYSVKLVIDEARKEGLVPSGFQLPHSTVHRLLHRHGLMEKRDEQGSAKDRRRFAYANAGQLWMSDVMHGPAVIADGRRKRKTYLIALLDDATRVVPYAAFCFAENTQAFLPVFKQAVMRRGVPERLYVDNGAVYRSHQLALACARLAIALIHARPYQPQGKGKIERYFRTVRMQLLPVLGREDLSSLEALNRRFWAWVEGEYHQSPHRGLDGETPLDRWAQSAGSVRHVEPNQDLDALFLWEAKRKVKSDRTVSLDGVLYEVAPELVRQNVILRYDPAAPRTKPLQVFYKGERYDDAKVLDAYANCFVKRERPTGNLTASEPAQTPPDGLSLSRFDDEANEEEK